MTWLKWTLHLAVVCDLLGSVKLSCSNCHTTATARQYKLHWESHCPGHYEVSSPSRVSARDILQRPTIATTLPVERRVAEHLVRWLLSESWDTTVVQIPTRGRVSSLPQCSQKRLPESCTICLAPESGASVKQPSRHF